MAINFIRYMYGEDIKLRLWCRIIHIAIVFLSPESLLFQQDSAAIREL